MALITCRDQRPRDVDVANKDRAATSLVRERLRDNGTLEYIKIPQMEFEKLQRNELEI